MKPKISFGSLSRVKGGIVLEDEHEGESSWVGRISLFTIGFTGNFQLKQNRVGVGRITGCWREW